MIVIVSLSGYGDKRGCAIETADAGAVPAGSTTNGATSNTPSEGAELGSTCFEKQLSSPGMTPPTQGSQPQVPRLARARLLDSSGSRSKVTAFRNLRSPKATAQLDLQAGLITPSNRR